MRRRLLFFALALSLATRAMADGSDVTSAPSLKLVRGARAAGMAGAYIALGDDALSLLYNPAGLTELREVELSASHLEWLDGVRDDSLSLGIPAFGLGAWGIGASYLSSEDMGRDNWGNPTVPFNNFDFSIQAAFALQLGDNGSAGLEYKVIRQGYNGSKDFGTDARLNEGSAFDLGFDYRLFDKKLVLAFTSQNMGSNLALGRSYAPMPLTFKGAVGWHASHALSLELDYENQPYDFLNKYRLGGEYSLDLGDETRAAFRAGYLLGPENASGGLSGFSAGLGAGWHAWHIDYAFVPRGDLGVSHFVTLSVGFGQH